MDYDEMFKKFEFLFEENNDVKEDIVIVKKNSNIVIEREKYAEIALKYIVENISQMAPITLLTNLGLYSLAQSLKLASCPRKINQFEIDFMVALVLKYGVMQIDYTKSCREEEIEYLLKAIYIYIFCYDHKLHKNSIVAYELNTYYRISRINGFDEDKLNIIKEFCDEYDKRTSLEKIKLAKVIRFIITIGEILVKRVECIAGRMIYLEKQYKFFMFFPNDIKEICDQNDLDYSKVISILSVFCCRIGELREDKIEEIYLHNPINDKPIILIEPGVFFLPNINAITMNLFEIFEKIIEIDSQDKRIYSKVRAEFLEKKTVEIIRSKYMTAGKIYSNSQWDDVRHGENDCTLVYENFAIVFEDKSGRLNRNTHKGVLKSAYDDNKKLIEELNEQAVDFTNLLKKNLGKEITLKIEGGEQNVIDLKEIRHILNVGVVFEETILQNMALGGKKHSPVVSIFQLNKIFKCLESEEIIDYFIKRSHIEKNIYYHADEYDFLFGYLQNGLNTSEKIYVKADENEIFFIPYTEKKFTRADLKREKWFQVILNSVIGQAKENWLDTVISLLGVPPVVQEQIIRDIFKQKKLELIDNIKCRNKYIIVELLDYFDYDTEKEIEEDIKKYSSFSEVLYIAFTEKLEHVIVKLKKH